MPGYSEEETRRAVERSMSYAESLRRLGKRPDGGNHKLFRHWVDQVWRIPTDHFDPHAARSGRRPRELSEVMVEGSSYSRAHLKRRLLAAGIKQPICEICGQGEMWRGRLMALILDHINGTPDDHRLKNLRILCPNCNELSILTVGGRIDRPQAVETVINAGNRSRRQLALSGTAPALAAPMRGAPVSRGDRIPPCARSPARPTKRSWRRSIDWDIRRPDASTASPTTRSENGCRSTSASLPASRGAMTGSISHSPDRRRRGYDSAREPSNRFDHGRRAGHSDELRGPQGFASRLRAGDDSLADRGCLGRGR